MLTILKGIFDYSIFISAVKLSASYTFIEIIGKLIKNEIEKYKDRDIDFYSCNIIVLIFAILFSIIAISVLCLYCLFFVYECAFTIYDILLRYHVLRNIY